MPYETIRRLGSGFFGEVWLEHDDALDRLCAAKYLDPSRLSHQSDLFIEAKAMISAQHDNVVTVYAADIDTSGWPVIRMEYLAKGSVEDKYSGSPAPVTEALQIIEDACRGIEHLHAKGFLHRDIKPANLLLTATNSVKVSDFGLSCKVTNPDNIPWIYAPHLPPESQGSQITTEVGDVYATGVTAYRIFNGRDIFVDTRPPNGKLGAAIKSGKYPNRNRWLPHIHKKVRQAVNKALHVDESKRWASASDFRRALEQARPKVSWQPSDTTIDRSWYGTERNAIEWRAEISLRRSKRYFFSVERNGNDKGWRHRKSYEAEFDSELEAIAHATKVLEQIAVDGS